MNRWRALSGLAGLLLLQTSWANDYPVDCGAINDLDANLNSAITAAQQGLPSRVLLGPGICSSGGPHHVDSAASLQIIGAGSGMTTIQLLSPNELLRVVPTTGSPAITLRGFTVKNAQNAAVAILGSSLRIDDVAFLQNSSNFGGAISATNVAMTIRNATFTSNSAQNGGAIAIEGAGMLDIADSTFDGNSAPSGGAIYANATTRIATSVFHDNLTAGDGGALEVFTTADISNSTFTLNGAKNGGAIAAESGSTLALHNVTLHNNSATTSGEAIFADTATLSFAATLLSGTCAGVITPSGSGSIESPGNTCALGPGNQASVSAASLMLGALANNGGPTQTLLPAAGSTMINAGGSPCASIDERHLVRNVGACDVGAVEVGATTPDEIFFGPFE